jgi:excisionase family DNA binding protein
MENTKTSSLLVKIADAQTILGFGRSTIYELCERREIESIKEGKARRIVRASLDAYVARKLKEQNTSPAATA